MNTAALFNEIRRTLLRAQLDAYDMLLTLREETMSAEIGNLANEVWDDMEIIRKKVYEVQVAHEGKK